MGLGWEKAQSAALNGQWRPSEAQCVHLDEYEMNQGQGQGAKPVNGVESIPVDEAGDRGSSARSDP